MNLRVLYCNHQSADLATREKLGFSTEEQFRAAYADLQHRFPETEVVIVSTCNRIELYFTTEQRGGLPEIEELTRFLAEFHQVPLDDFFGVFEQLSGADAARHLFLVACSLDSMVLGESQIVNQIKTAYQRSAENDAVGPISNQLFQSALNVASRVRTETKLSEGRTSIASVAVGEFGKGIFERFDDKRVLIVGAGEMAEETLRYLADEGVREILIANRRRSRAEELAAEWTGSVLDFAEWKTKIPDVDVIVSTTGATEPIISREEFAQWRARSASRRPLFILDLGAPRDFDSAIAEVDENVFLYDIQNLEQTCALNRQRRSREIAAARAIVEQATDQFMHDCFHRTTAPVVQQLRTTWHTIGEQELERLFKKLEHLDPADRDQIRQTMSRIVNKLLHPPLETIKHHSREGTPHTLLETVKQLFGLRE